MISGLARPPHISVFGAIRACNPENGGQPGAKHPQCGGCTNCTPPPHGGGMAYEAFWTTFVIWKIGMYSAMIMPPTMTPRNAMSSGSISEVKASVVASTSAS